jgi:hypothetical protein
VGASAWDRFDPYASEVCEVEVSPAREYTPIYARITDASRWLPYNSLAGPDRHCANCGKLLTSDNLSVWCKR